MSDRIEIEATIHVFETSIRKAESLNTQYMAPFSRLRFQGSLIQCQKYFYEAMMNYERSHNENIGKTETRLDGAVCENIGERT